MLDPNDLPETAVRRRVTGTAQSPRGKVLAAGISTQTLRCLIQPHRGNLKYEVEGVLQDVTESLYCNLTQGAGTPTDIQEMDTLVRASGQQRRVVFVADEGGQGDHLKVYLVAVSGAGSGTDGGSLAPGGSAGVSVPSPLQAQIDALTQQFTTLQTQLASTQTQLGTLQVSFSNYQPSGVEPVVPVTAAAVTLAMPTVDTVYEVKPSANQVITLPPAPGIVNGVAPVLHLDLQQLGGFTCALALCSANAGNAGAADQYVPSTTATTTAQNIANAIASGAASISLRSLQIGFWSIE